MPPSAMVASYRPFCHRGAEVYRVALRHAAARESETTEKSFALATSDVNEVWIPFAAHRSA